MFTNLKRVFSFAFTDFSRNGGISVAAIFILVITIFLVTGLFLVHGLSGFLVSQVQDKIDITAYFKSTTPESSILDIQTQLSQLSPNIKSVEYVSEVNALANFTEKHKDNAVFNNALTQVGGNPFLPSLNIVTNGNPEEYQQIANLLQSDQFSQLIDSVDYSQKKDIIEKVFSITSNINKFGIALAILLVIVAILVVFNTIRLAINSSKEEISTMQIVGASRWFVQAPYIIQGALFGVIAFIICFVVTLVLAYFLSPSLSVVLPGFSLFGYAMSQVWLIVGMQLGVGVGLGVISSAIVVNKYLKI